jgi:hypothetical protein
MASLPPSLQSIVVANSTIYKVPLTDKAIRIVELHPGSGDTDIVCSLVVVDIALSGAFHALSYCWGKEQADRHILCNGQPFQVTRNLYAALQRLRLTSEVLYLWIDAVPFNPGKYSEQS